MPKLKSTRTEMNTVIPLNKPRGITSFTAIQAFKRKHGIVKIGHAGTLDKMASGLMVVLLGKATRFSQLFMDLPKKYRARFIFGQTTATLDCDSPVSAYGPLPSLQQIIEAISFFEGDIDQIPPDYSALKLQGQRASDRVRRGETVELKARPITIYQISIHSYSEQEGLDLSISCSKGTYIRSLARDIAAKLGTVAYMSDLVRTNIGAFDLSMAIGPHDENFRWQDSYRFFLDMLPHTSEVFISEEEFLILKTGQIPTSLQLTTAEVSVERLLLRRKCQESFELSLVKSATEGVWCFEIGISS